MRKALLAGTVVASSVLAIGANATVTLEWARAYDADEETFSAYLAERYAALAIFEADRMNDREDAEAFVEKAWSAMQGETVNPVMLKNYEIEDGDARAELATARAALVSAHTENAQTLAPRDLAIAQVAFDCWTEQVEEGFQEDDIAACRGVFYDYMNQVEMALPMPADGERVYLVDDIEANGRAVVFFDLDVTP